MGRERTRDRKNFNGQRVVCYMGRINKNKNHRKNLNAMREKLIQAIVDFLGDEISEFTKQDFIELAKESDEALLDRVIHILWWYHNEYNNN